MPPWGRPPGGRKAKGKKQWERQPWEWEDMRRFEEIDSDSDDGNGVGLGQSFAGDELQFTGGDLGRNYGYSDDSGESDFGVGDDMRSGNMMQLALKEKEEVLVERAMARIRRAKLLGKPNVKLTPLERDALERLLQKDQATTAKEKRPSSKPRASSRRDSGRSSGSQNSIGPAAGRRKSKSSLNSQRDRETSSTGQPVAPGFVVAGPDGRPIYAPIGYYPPSPGLSPYGPSSRPESRSGSSHSLQHTPPLPQGQFRAPPKQRYSSLPEHHFQSSSTSRGPPSPRPMPDELDWQPRARSSSNLPYPVDPFQYQTNLQRVPQLPAQYTQGRRNVTGPAGVGYPTLRAAAPVAHSYASSSDPSLLRRAYPSESGNTESPSDDDDDEDEGVQVNVVPYGQSYDINLSTGGPRGSRPRKSRR
jgi:hypothetical protein